MKCIECGGTTEARQQSRELQLDLPYNVVVHDAPVEVCPNCGAEYGGIAAPQRTFHAVADWIARRPGRLHGSEVRFLRNTMGWSQEQLGRRLGVAMETVSRWENARKPVGYQSELALRFLILVGDAVADQLSSDGDLPVRVEVENDAVVKAAS